MMTRLMRRMLVVLATLLAIGAALLLMRPGPTAEAHHDVHFNYWYWQQWAYAPLSTVTARDCGISQNAALQGAATEWNATGYVLISTVVDANCQQDPDGIRWKAGNAGCYGLVTEAELDAEDNYLDPDTWVPPTNRAVKIDIRIGTGCANGDSTCAGWYSPCDVLTHEMGHALGLADHYRNATADGGPSYTVFSYPNPPVNGTPVNPIDTIMDYPHRTNITAHDTGDLNTLYRRAPFSPANMGASNSNFHRINLGWLDRSHNENAFYIERSVGGGAYNFTKSVGTNVQSTTQDIVAPGQSYCYRAYGRNSWGGSGALSNSSCTTPPHAVGSSIGGSFPAGSTNVGLCWDPAPGGAAVSGYYVLRRRDNGNGTYTNTLYLEPVTLDCWGGGAVAWVGTVSSTAYNYHWSVRGCDGSWGCSDYKDMTSPAYQWVRLPWTGSGNTGSPTSGYHGH